MRFWDYLPQRRQAGKRGWLVSKIQRGTGGDSMGKLIGVLLLNLTLFCCFVDAQSPIPSTYFGMHDNKTSNWPPLPLGTLRLWDSATNWAKMQPTCGAIDFSHLDAFIAEAHANGVTDIMWNPSITPTCYSSHPTDSTCNYATGGCWAPADVDSGNTRYQNFLTAVINHVGPGIIKIYEGWNEPQNSPMWKDTLAHLKNMQTTLYKTVQSLDPTALVAMPAGYLVGSNSCCVIQNLVANGFGAISDINTFHGYYCNPEGTVANISAIHSAYAAGGLDSRPLWKTEGGWGTNTGCPDSATYPANLARQYLLQWQLGVTRFYWYAYDNTVWGTLGSGQTLNSAGIAYREVSNWMVGASGGQCSSAGNIWTCDFTRTSPSGYNAKAVWYTAGTLSFTVPAGFTTGRDLSGNTFTVSGGQSIQIDGFPVLLESTQSSTQSPQPPTGLAATVH
jgi:hypothetical protein